MFWGAGVELNVFHLGDYGIPYGYSPLLVASEQYLQCVPVLFSVHASPSAALRALLRLVRASLQSPSRRP